MKKLYLHSQLAYFALFILFVLFCNCQQKAPESQDASISRTVQVQQTAEEYFATFSQRQDWDKLCSFYREDLIFDDVLLHLHLDSLWKFKRFYNWPDTGFHKLSAEQEHLAVESLVANDSMAVARGHLNPFYYYGKLVDSDWGMEFTIWLYFDEHLKIRKQVDWFEYDPTVMESVIQRYRSQGVDKIPDWLDLNK